MRFCLLLIFLVGLTTAFDVQLKYRCSSSQCTYYFVVPEIVAGYVDPNVLQSEVNGLAGSIHTLKNLLTEAEKTEAGSMTNFTDTVDAQYNVSSPIIINVTTQATDPAYQQSVQDLTSASAKLILDTGILVSQMGCFKDGSIPSAVCLQYPTTTAAPTTTPQPTTKITVVTTGAPIGSSPKNPVTTKPATTKKAGGTSAAPVTQDPSITVDPNATTEAPDTQPTDGSFTQVTDNASVTPAGSDGFGTPAGTDAPDGASTDSPASTDSADVSESTDSGSTDAAGELE